ncbi:MAG TPA: Ig-like domain-containing protein [Longimicrobium sp.]|nr:Ig-like domain-containing protein [Longimicrobium sp.]
MPIKRPLALAAAAALLLAACDRNPAQPAAAVATVALAPDERVLAVGELLALEATVRDTRGGEPSDPELEWSSDAPAVASVDANGVVTGVAPGTASIRATAGGKSGSVQVVVAAAPAACVPGGGRTLAVGESYVAGGISAAVTCLSGGPDGAEFVAVPVNAEGDLTRLFLAAATQGTVPVQDVDPARMDAARLAGGRLPDAGWEGRFRRRAARDLERWVDAARGVAVRSDGRAELAPRLALRTRDARVGDEVSINASTVSCEQEKVRAGRVVAVTAHAIVVADRENPSGGFSDAEYLTLAERFETVAWPAVTESFGVPADVDENGRVVIFYTRAVNELTPPGSGAFVAGFFHPRDLFPTRDRDGLDACGTSNYAEILYMLAPDPSGAVNGNDFSRGFVLGTSAGTLAHELQHLVNASRRLYEVDTPFWEETVWLNEGLSHVAEELAFHRASGLGPRQEVGAAALANTQVRDAFTGYQAANVDRYERFLRDPEHQSPLGESTDDDDLETRGATWAFLRYAADRKGGDQAALWRALAGGSLQGLANLQSVLGVDPRLWLRDWTASVIADDAVAGLDARHRQPSWSFRSLLGGLPLNARTLGPDAGAGLQLAPGSGAFLRFGVPAGGTGSLRFISGSAPPPSRTLLTVIRTR